MRRRTFVGAGAGLMAGVAMSKLSAGATKAGSGGGSGEAVPVPKRPRPGAPSERDVKLPPGGTMPKRRLGRTGVEVSLLGLGGFHVGLARDEQTAVRIVRSAIDGGVTFMDNCWDYNDGKSEEWMGRALRDGYRQKVFLMTKIDGRTRASAAEQIDQSLKRLGTDVIDLVQIHEVIRMSDADRVFGPSGAIEALEAARKAGKIRFVGFTGHKSPQIHLKMLTTAFAQKFRFDAVQLPLNVMDAHHDSFERLVLPVLIEHDIGVLGMKPLGSGLFLRSAALRRNNGAVTPTDCLQYAMNLHTSVVITGCDTPGILKQGLNAAYRYQPFQQDRLERVLGATAPDATGGAWEKYKTSETFDGTAQHPWWLETASLQKP